MIRGASYPQDVFKSFLIHDVGVWRPQMVADGQGGYEKSYLQIGTIKGRMSTIKRTGLGGTERFIGAEHVSKLGYELFTLPDVDLQRNDIVSVDGRRFRVIFSKEPSLFGHHLEWTCEEVDPNSHQVYAGLPQTPTIS